jgi:hypothetical protein
MTRRLCAVLALAAVSIGVTAFLRAQAPIAGGIALQSSGAGCDALPVTTGLIAQYQMDDGSGTTLHDCSGSGNNATLSVSSPPTWSTSGLNYAVTKQWVELPVALNAAQTIILFYNATTPLATNTGSIVGNFQPILWGPSGGSSAGGGAGVYIGNVGQHMPSSPGQFPSIILGSNEITTSLDNASNTRMIAYVMSASQDSLYIDGKPVSNYSSRGAGLTTVTGNYQIGNGSTGISASITQFVGSTYYMLAYNTQLTATQVASVYAALANRLRLRGVTLTLPVPGSANTNSYVALGDSTTAAVNAATPYTSQMSGTLTGTYAITNFGVPGSFSSQMPTFALGRMGNLSSGTDQVCGIWIGINDTFAGTSVYPIATTIGYMRQTALICHQAGAKVIVGTLMSLCGFETQRNALNTAIYASWQSFADGLADMAINATMGPNGSCSNVTYFQDGTHPTTAGNAIVGSVFAAAVNTAFAAH